VTTEPLGMERLWHRILELLFPAHCVACRRYGAWLCNECLAEIPGQGQPQLVPWPHLAAGGLMDVYSLSPHTHPLREAVHALKYGGVRVLAEPLATLLAAGLTARPLWVDVLVPVPLHIARIRQRGYNQSELLARALGELCDLPVAQDDLMRHRPTRSQVGLSPDQRHANVAGAFACRSDALAGQRVLLIDDVLTTGATLTACAAALRAAGATQVWGLTLTYAQHGPRRSSF
jgi:ComF family protein